MSTVGRASDGFGCSINSRINLAVRNVYGMCPGSPSCLAFRRLNHIASLRTSPLVSNLMVLFVRTPYRLVLMAAIGNRLISLSDEMSIERRSRARPYRLFLALEDDQR